MILVNVDFPYQFAAGFDRHQPIASGYIYIGEPDLDPEILANQKTIYFVQEDGNEVVGAQPIRTSAGGVPTYNGSPVAIKTEGDYSIKILDKNSVQVYYSPNSNVDEALLNALQTVDTLAELKDVDASGFTGVEVWQYGGYLYKWVTGDFSAEAAADGVAVYIPSDHVSATIGVWKLQYEEFVDAAIWPTIQDALSSPYDVVISESITTSSTLTISAAKETRIPEGVSITLAAGANTTLIEVSAAGAAISGNGVIDGNKAAQTSGTSPTVHVSGVTGVKIKDVEIKNARGDNILAAGATRLCVSKVNSHSATNYGLLATNGSSRLKVLYGQYHNNGKDGIYVTHGGGSPSDKPRIIGPEVYDNGTASFDSGIRLRYVEGGLIKSALCTGHAFGAGIIIESASNSLISRNCTIEGSVASNNFDGCIIDDYCQRVKSIGGQYHSNTQDGIDINDTLYCESIGDSCSLNGEKGLLLWGSRFATVTGGEFINNNTATTDPNDAGIVVKVNATTGRTPTDCTISGATCRDDQGVQTQGYGIHIFDGQRIVCLNNRVKDNKFGGINDSTGSPQNNPKKYNPGYKTEAAGNMLLPTGNTSVTLTSGHTGLVGTGATLEDVQVTPNSDLGGVSFWVSALTSQGFTINVSSALGGNVFFRWRAENYSDVE